MTNPAAVSPLDAVRGVVRIAKAASVGVTGNKTRIEAAERAIAAFAELLAADRELDEANSQIGLAELPGSSRMLAALVRVSDARRRRAAAIAAFGEVG